MSEIPWMDPADLPDVEVDWVAFDADMNTPVEAEDGTS